MKYRLRTKRSTNLKLIMEIEVKRFAHGNDDTLGLLFVDCVFECFTLEDEYRSKKVKHETRIPEGRYKIELRNEGGMTAKYAEKYDFHEGMLWLRDVPNFEYIYIHTGNNDDHSSGCLLVGDTCQTNLYKNGFIGNSRTAYERLYKKIVNAMKEGEVWVDVTSM